MKFCTRCFREFDENAEEVTSPARDLGDIFSESVNMEDICPECREELGLVNLMASNPHLN